MVLEACSSSSMLIFLSVYSLIILAQASIIFYFQTDAISSSRNPGIPKPATLDVTLCPLGHGAKSGRTVNGLGSIWPYQVFKSATFNPPQLQVTRNGKQLAPGFLFFGPSSIPPVIATQDEAPLIMTDAGQLVWNGPYLDARNFRVASYEGKAILTFWSGFDPAGESVGHGYGNITFLDSSYTKILTVCPKLGLVTPTNTTYECEADWHESYLTSRNTLLVTAYNVTPTDLSSIGGPEEGWDCACLFLEINPQDGNIRFRWSALKHVPVSESKRPLRSNGRSQSQPFDYFHINSIETIGDNYLVSARQVWSTYLVSSTGEVIWTIKGDTGGDFGPLPPHGHFVGTHPITCLCSTTLTSRPKSLGNTTHASTPSPAIPSPSAGSITTTVPSSAQASNSSSHFPLQPVSPPLFAASDPFRTPPNLSLPNRRAHSPSFLTATSL